MNFGTIFPDGRLGTNYICASAEKLGDVGIGVQYLEGIASLIPGASVLKKGNSWTWRVVVGGVLPSARPLLEKAEAWAALIEETQKAFIRKIEDQVEFGAEQAGEASGAERNSR